VHISGNRMFRESATQAQFAGILVKQAVDQNPFRHASSLSQAGSRLRARHTGTTSNPPHRGQPPHAGALHRSTINPHRGQPPHAGALHRSTIKPHHSTTKPALPQHNRRPYTLRRNQTSSTAAHRRGSRTEASFSALALPGARGRRRSLPHQRLPACPVRARFRLLPGLPSSLCAQRHRLS